jgi:hypothetical protein
LIHLQLMTKPTSSFPDIIFFYLFIQDTEQAVTIFARLAIQARNTQTSNQYLNISISQNIYFSQLQSYVYRYKLIIFSYHSEETEKGLNRPET